MSSHNIRSVVGPLAVCWILLLCACTYDPAYSGLICAPGDGPDLCPSGYHCFQAQRVCIPNSQEPAGQDDGQAVDDGGPGDDGGPDACCSVDDTGPGDDGGMDDASDGPADGNDGGPGDPGPCGSSGLPCLPGHYCNGTGSTATCDPCEVPDHCGPSCQVCPTGNGCLKPGNGDACCQPPCNYGDECSLFNCSDTYLCKPTIAVPNSSYAWEIVPDPGHPPTPYCDLTPAASLLPQTECLVGDQGLAFHCSQDGTCTNGSCSLPANPLPRSHDCGGAFGCDPATGKCRMHFKEGQACWYNYDCESFCCSRANNAQCVVYNDTACKIFTTYYEHIDITPQHTFLAKGTTDPHAIGEWSWSDGDSAATCANDHDCDSGHCSMTTAGHRCTFVIFQGCVGIGDSASTRNTYFCEASGGQAAHLILVTNQVPDPPAADCGQ